MKKILITILFISGAFLAFSQTQASSSDKKPRIEQSQKKVQTDPQQIQKKKQSKRQARCQIKLQKHQLNKHRTGAALKNKQNLKNEGNSCRRK